MNDFLKQLRSGGKRFDKSRRPYDNPQYRSPERQNGRDRKGQIHRKTYDQNQLNNIRKVLETIVNGQKLLADHAERQTVATERIADALELIGVQLGAPAPPKREAGEKPKPEQPETGESPETSVEARDDEAMDMPVSHGRDAIIDMIVGMREEGATFEEIAGRLIDDEIPTLTGKGQWRAQNVSRLFNQRDRIQA